MLAAAIGLVLVVNYVCGAVAGVSTAGFHYLLITTLV